MPQSLIILDASELSVRLRELLTLSAQRQHLYHCDTEDLYDWVVTRAFSNLLFLKVRGHVRGLQPNDVFETIYQEVGYETEFQLNQYILSARLTFLRNESVKMLVSYNNIVIVRSF